MESLVFAVCLFLITLTVLCWIVTPAKEVQKVTNTTNISEVETPVVQEITTQEVVINEQKDDSQAEEMTTKETPVVQDFQEEFIDNKPIEEVQNNNSKTQESNEKISGIDLKNTKTYLLHKHRCIKLKDLPNNFQLPENIKTYNLRNEQVVRVSALEALIAA